MAGASSSKDENGEQIAVRPSVSQKIAARVPAYLQNCRANVVTMTGALDRVDFETVTRLGHDMRGSGGAFGFQAITDIGAALQHAAEHSNTDAARKCVGELSVYLDRAENGLTST